MPLIEVHESWLAQVHEEAIDPTRRIVDPHHHFFAESQDFPYYDLATLRADTASHRVEQTVYLQCWEGYRKTGPEDMMPVGETEWVDTIAAHARETPGETQIGAMIGTAELRAGDAVRAVLETHVAASPLFRGIRQIAAWDASGELFSPPGLEDGELYADPAFRAGFKVLVDLGLVFDAYHYHPQTPQLTALARAFPDASINLNHLGTPVGIGPYAGRQADVFKQWKADLSDLAACPNVTIKLGGLAMPWCGFAFEQGARPPDSDEIVKRQAAYYHTAIEIFGPDRCMFESNFPVDKCAMSYAVLWNAFKKIAADYTEAEKDAMFYATASRFYGLQPHR